MSNKGNHSAQYSTSDIEKYLKGELSAREMHELESAALEDPFLADAIDGLTLNASLHPNAPIEQDLADLHERLAARVDGTRRKHLFILRPVRLAAAVILLLGIGYSFFYLFTRHKTPEVVAKSTLPAKSETASAPILPAADSTAVAINVRPHQPIHRNSLFARTYKTKNNSLSDTARQRSDVIAPNAAAANVASNLTGKITDQLKSVSLDSALARNNNTHAPDFGFLKLDENNLNFHGTIIDQQNRPVPGAYLTLNNNRTVTNNLGQFAFDLKPADTPGQLTISGVGYSQQSFALNNLNANGQKDNIIRLTPQTAGLDEVVVVGYGKQRKEAKFAAPSASAEHLDTLWKIATPTIGRQAYLEYIAVGKKKLGLDSAITGTETISFLVNRDGTLTSFKIEESLSPAHDAAILRLVTEGPAWRLLKGKKTRAAVTVKF